MFCETPSGRVVCALLVLWSHYAIRDSSNVCASFRKGDSPVPPGSHSPRQVARMSGDDGTPRSRALISEQCPPPLCELCRV